MRCFAPATHAFHTEFASETAQTHKQTNENTAVELTRRWSGGCVCLLLHCNAMHTCHANKMHKRAETRQTRNFHRVSQSSLCGSRTRCALIDCACDSIGKRWQDRNGRHQFQKELHHPRPNGCRAPTPTAAAGGSSRAENKPGTSGARERNALGKRVCAHNGRLTFKK